jgi:hypothetical protein
MRTVLRTAGIAAAALAIAASSLWGAGLMYFAGPGGAGLRAPLAVVPAVLGLACIAGLCVARWRRPALALAAAVFALLLAWFFSIQPSNERQWRPEVARLPHATIQGKLVTVRDIRNFDYRSEDDFTPRYYDRTFDLDKLDSVDLVAVYWMGPAIAHVFVTFGFGDDHLAVSIEARKESNESYSTLGGFFRQYELMYVVGDERDIIRLRTNYRKDPPEDVYVMRLNGGEGTGTRFFLDYMDKINQLHAKPEFYNTLTTNCTTSILHHASKNPGSPSFSWRILASGYAPEHVYEAGRLDTSLPFPELFRRSRVNEAAQAADAAPDFSRRIRAGLPGMDPR